MFNEKYYEVDVDDDVIDDKITAGLLKDEGQAEDEDLEVVMAKGHKQKSVEHANYLA